MKNNKYEFSNYSLDEINTVGIWTSTIINNEKYFIKDKKFSYEYFNWARISQIPPKSEKNRIVFIGESVARGFLYDPYINPALILENILNENFNQKKAEVIDLARTDLNMSMLIKLCGESIALEPDCIVIFSGNNWKASVSDFTHEENEKLYSIKDDIEMIRYVKTMNEKKISESINIMTDFMNKISEKYNIPIIFIIPEFNLKDWKHNMGNELFPLNNTEPHECINLKKQIEDAFAIGDYYRAELHIKELLQLDNLSSLGYEFMAKLMLQRGRVEEARKYFELALDTDMYMPYTVPGCYSIIRKMLIEKAREYNFAVVNLPEIFKEYLGGGIPGNDLFIDYCHLTLEGMNIAMEHLAAKVFTVLKISEISGENIKVANKGISGEALSKAHFFAAIHCAHHSVQPYEVLLYHCRKSLESAKSISILMNSFVDLAVRKIPWLYNKNFKSIINDSLTNQYPFLVENIHFKNLDIKLVEAMVQAMEENGIFVRQEINDIRVNEHKATIMEKINLKEQYYRNGSHQKSYYFIESCNDYLNVCKATYLSMIDVESLFHFIADKNNDIVFELTLRGNYKIAECQNIKVKVNNNLIFKERVLNVWMDISFKVSKELLNDNGVNTILIEWYSSGSRIELKLEDNYEDNMFNLLKRRYKPVYGEINRFTVGVSKV